MILSIITINRNNSIGLRKTMESVASQSFKDFEYVVVDGASTDDSVEVIRGFESSFGTRLIWVSETDAGIYNAMNKGIGMASGRYIQILNSGDCLNSSDVSGKMVEVLGNYSYPSILYGNMIKVFPDGRRLRDLCLAGKDISFLDLFMGTLNHSPAYIERKLFDKYGKYDEGLKIVADWKWYLQAIILGEERPVYIDIDVTLFDMTGISETNKALDKTERRMVLSDLIPEPILADYVNYGFAIEQFIRLNRYPVVYKLVWLIERALFKIEKRRMKKTGVSKLS